MSIFDNVFSEKGWKCVVATKNITKTSEYSHINVYLVYELDDRQVDVTCVYSVNVGGKISKEEPVKMLVKMFRLGETDDDEPEELMRRRLSAYRPEEMTDQMIKDINATNIMFDQADKSVSRVYL